MEPMITGRRIVGLSVDYEFKPVISSGVSLDFFRDLLRGTPDPAKDYSAPLGVVGYSRGAARYTATYDDGTQAPLTHEQYESAIAKLQAAHPSLTPSPKSTA